MNVSGTCHCGSITFTALIDPSKVMVCHCADCQQLTGSAFRIVVPASGESFKMNGTPTLYTKIADSGAKRSQAFCPQCGTPIYSADPDNPKQLSLRVGTLNERAQLTPSMQIWQKSALPWAKCLLSIPGSEMQELFKT